MRTPSPILAIAMLLGLLATAQAGAQDEPEAQPAAAAPSAAAAEYAAIEKEYDEANSAFLTEYRAAKTDEERSEIITAKMPKAEDYAQRFIDVAKKHPDDPAALDALLWCLNNVRSGDLLFEAADLVADKHVGSDKLASLPLRIGYSHPKVADKLLAALMERGANREIKGAATYARARSLKDRVEAVRILQQGDSTGETERMYVGAYGADVVAEWKQLDADALERSLEQMFEQAAREYGDVKYGRSDIAKVAERDLFEMRNLAIGKVAPEIEGEDLDGNPLKLSGFRGKVVVLDFWGDW